jgi:hypothetical protein
MAKADKEEVTLEWLPVELETWMKRRRRLAILVSQ